MVLMQAGAAAPRRAGPGPSTAHTTAGGSGAQRAHVESTTRGRAGGWGTIIETPNGTSERSAGAAGTDSEAMALHGVLSALGETDPTQPLEITTSNAAIERRIVDGAGDADATPIPAGERHHALWEALRTAQLGRNVHWRWLDDRDASTAATRALELARAQAERHAPPQGARHIETPISAAMLRRQLERAGPNARVHTEDAPERLRATTLAAWLDTIPGATMVRTRGAIRITPAGEGGNTPPDTPLAAS